MKALSLHSIDAGAIIYFGFMLLAAFVFVTQREDIRQYQQTAPEGKLHFRIPRASRIIGALVRLAFLGGIPTFAGVNLNPRTIGTVTGSIADDIWLTSLFFLLASFGSSLLAGPDEVLLDLSARTYRRTWGWPLFPRTASGSMRDISGVYVDNVGTFSNPVFLVGLRWRGNDISIVGRYDNKEQAEWEADELQQALGSQRVKPPF